ncbi:MAG: NAD+ synthase [Thermodesulfobacteriota bacterium]
MRTLRIAMAQINPIVGDLQYNHTKILSYIMEAQIQGADLVIFPELALTGYPPEDLLHKTHFIDDNLSRFAELTAKTPDITAIIGFVDREKDNSNKLYNAAGIVQGKEVKEIYHKIMLPNYGVFDEERYFQAGTTPLCITLNQIVIGIGICEDIWRPDGPAKTQAEAGAEIIVNINASPFHMGKAGERETLLTQRARDFGVFVAYNNMVGGQDELVFDGRGIIVDTNGNITHRAKAFSEDLIIADIELDDIEESGLIEKSSHVRITVIETEKKTETKPLPKNKERKLLEPPLDPIEEVLSALELGTKDYAEKNGFAHAVIAISGGIDSALVAAIAARVLGAENITGVFMPSRFSAESSEKDAELLAKNLGIDFTSIPIDGIFASYLELLKAPFDGKEEGTAEENLQARIRGNIIMALSNKFGYLVLTTGNKSETGVGYATLYGDMAGGFAVIKDVPKTLVYALARHINEISKSEVIPESIITKEPSAELRANQKDSDTLPPYVELDAILKAYVEEDKGIDEISALGFPKELVSRIVDMVDHSEYKRRQAPPGIKITARAYGKDRRMPITNGYEDKT